MKLAVQRLVVLFTLSLLVVASAPAAPPPQARMNDKDIESVMNNLKQDAKKFRSLFNTAVDHSTIRKTTDAKNAKQLAQTFQQQCEGMYNHFKDSHEANSTLPPVLNSARQIENLHSQFQFGHEADAQWKKVQSELSILATQFNVN